MKYKIIGDVMPALEFTLNRSEIIKSQAGAMKWFDNTIEMDTKMKGGVGGFLKRKVMGESGFLNVFEAKADDSKLAFGHSYPGHIIPVDIDNESVICQRRAFLCGTEDINLEVAFQKKLGSGLFSGEGFILQRIEGSGTAFVELDGEIVDIELGNDETIKVETGSVGMFEPGVDMDIQRVRGFNNLFFGGEGMFLTTLKGPGKVWLQTMPIQSHAGELNNYINTGKK